MAVYSLEEDKKRYSLCPCVLATFTHFQHKSCAVCCCEGWCCAWELFAAQMSRLPDQRGAASQGTSPWDGHVTLADGQCCQPRALRMVGVPYPRVSWSLDQASAVGCPPSTTVAAVPCRVQQTQGRGSTATSDREAPRAAKFLISIIKACSFLPVDVPSKSLHQRSHLCEELHRLQEAHVSGLIVQSHLATADTWTQLAPDTSHCHRWTIQCRSG